MLFLPQDMSEQTVSPFASIWIQDTVQRFLRDGLRIDDVSDAFYALKSFESF